jgi:hypothetical protein
MPRIEEVAFSFEGSSGEIQSETRFRMNESDIQCWLMEEERIVKVARVIQLRYGIPGGLPPKPSSFHFDRAHKSHRIAKRMICISREWFAIWMGLVSYFIAKSASLDPSGKRDDSTPAPDWYNHLRNQHDFSETWLDGLRLSTVCTFDLGTPRAGIIFRWSEEDRNRETIEWFYNHHIPLWFVWSSKEEQAISTDRSLAYLQPPDELIQQALTTLFTVPNIPLAGLILQQFYRLGDNPVTNKTIEFLSLQNAPSFVFEFTTRKFLGQEDSLVRTRLGRTQEAIDDDLRALKVSQENQRQAAAEAASSFSYHGLLTSKRQAAAQAASSSAQAAWTSSEDAWTSPENAWTSPENAWTTPENAWTTPENAWTSPENAWTSPENAWPSAEAASSVSFRDLFTRVEEKEKIYNHYNDFFTARERRQKEMLKVESDRDRQIRESRARNPGVKKANVYEWEKTQSSGGREVYRRVKVNKKRNEDVYCFYKPYQRLYNAFANEWDLFEDFCFGKKDGDDSDSDLDEDDDEQSYPKNSVSRPTPLPSLPAPMNVVEHEDSPADPMNVAEREDSPAAPANVAEHEDSSAAPTFSRDPFKMLSLVYGYLPRSGADDSLSIHNWDGILRFLGFVRNLHQLDVPEPEKSAIMNFFGSMVSNAGAGDIGGTDFENLKRLFTFEQVQRPSENLFVFSSPPSNACKWVLGVHSPVAALYVCRYILENPHAHTILTVADRLLDQGIAFRTLLPLSCSTRQVTVTDPYVPRTYRLNNHTFTKDDFDVAMLACQSVLTSSQGRAALLRGGIVGRIAREFLSRDGVLDGPSVEVTAHRVGYIAPGNDNTRFCDDELTDNEIAIICGTYSLYTGEFLLFICLLFFYICFHSGERSSCRVVMVSPSYSLGSQSFRLQLAYLDRAK